MRWNVVSRSGLPTTARRFIITVESRGLRHTDIGYYSAGDWRHAETGKCLEDGERRVVAWTDYPQPYRGKIKTDGVR